MQSAPLHPDEESRLEQLVRYEILDTEDERSFDELTELASEICGTSISLISLVDVDRQWFKSKVGLDASQTDRSIAFCSHAILQDDVFEVENASQDQRFHDNPLVTGAPDIRFYAGAPLVTSQGYPLGTLCVIDQEVKKLNDFQKKALKILSKQVVSQLELRLQARKAERLNRDREKFYAILAHDLKSPFNGILNLSRILSERAASFSPEQVSELSSEILDASVTAYQVMDEILQWSQTKLGDMTVDLEPVNVLMAVQDTQNLLKNSLDAKNVSIDLDIDQSLEALADEALFKTVVRNLAMNAIKYTPTDSTIVIDAKADDRELRIGVADQGSGVGDELKKSLFVGAVESQIGSAGELGHGLGLSLAGDFIKRQHGEIEIDEQYRDGARFVIRIPKA